MFDTSSHKVAFTADITKAFLQIANKSSCGYMDLQPKTENELCIMRMCRVVFGVSPRPFMLAATIRKHKAVCNRAAWQSGGTERLSPTMTLFPVEQVENSDENNSVGEKVFSYSNSRSSQKTQ